MLFCFSCLTFNPKDIFCAKYREKRNLFRITINGRKRESREGKTTCFVDQQHHVTGVHQTVNSVLACTCDPLHDLAPLRSKWLRLCLHTHHWHTPTKMSFEKFWWQKAADEMLAQAEEVNVTSDSELLDLYLTSDEEPLQSESDGVVSKSDIFADSDDDFDEVTSTTSSRQPAFPFPPRKFYGRSVAYKPRAVRARRTIGVRNIAEKLRNAAENPKSTRSPRSKEKPTQRPTQSARRKQRPAQSRRFKQKPTPRSTQAPKLWTLPTDAQVGPISPTNSKKWLQTILK